MDTKDIGNRFEYHAPDEQRKLAHEAARGTILQAAARINALILVESREKSLAITKLEEAMFWANAAIARAD